MDKDGWEDVPVGGSFAAEAHVLDHLVRCGLGHGPYRRHAPCGQLVADEPHARIEHMRDCEAKGAEMARGKSAGTSKEKDTVSAKQAAADVLRIAGGPLHVKEIAKRVVEDYKTGLKGKTPDATIAAQLHVAAAKGDTFVKVDRGMFDLIDRTAAAGAAAEPEPVDGEGVVDGAAEPTGEATQDGEAEPEDAEGAPKPASRRRKKEPAAA